MTIKKPSFPASKKTAVLLCSAVLVPLLLLAGWLGIQAAADPYDCRMADGVSIGGVDVSGKTLWETRSTVQQALEESLYSLPLTVRLPGEDLTLTPEDSDVHIRLWKALRAAYACGREEGALPQDISLLPFLAADQAWICQQLQDYASRQDTDLVQPSWELMGDSPDLSTEHFDPQAPGQTLVLTMGIPKVRADVDGLYQAIAEAYAQAISLCASGTFSISPEVSPEVLPQHPDMTAIAREISREAVEDSLDLTTYTFVPGAYGYGIDPETAQALVDDASYAEVIELPLTATAPEILGDAVYFRDVLGHCETKHNTDENRNTNLRIMCKALDGLILQPGEEFSYNAAVGERTKERGYMPATAYSGSRMVKDYGGGVCQGSTTLYNCALLADVEILERVCHGAKVTYVPLGLDAAVNWNTKTDLRFKNNFHFPMMIKAEVSDGYVRMHLLGTDEKDYYVEMHTKVSSGDAATYAASYKHKISKETGEVLSEDLEARSSYYPID